jgi:hypothetical protein
MCLTLALILLLAVVTPLHQVRTRTMWVSFWLLILTYVIPVSALQGLLQVCWQQLVLVVLLMAFAHSVHVMAHACLPQPPCWALPKPVPLRCATSALHLQLQRLDTVPALHAIIKIPIIRRSGLLSCQGYTLHT